MINEIRKMAEWPEPTGLRDLHDNQRCCGVLHRLVHRAADMKADFTLKIEFEAEAQGRWEAENRILVMMKEMKPILDQYCGQDDWAFDWTVDYSRTIAKLNKRIEDAKAD